RLPRTKARRLAGKDLLTVVSFWRELRFWFRSAATTPNMLNKFGPHSPWENCLPCITYLGLLPGPYDRLSRGAAYRATGGCAAVNNQHSQRLRLCNIFSPISPNPTLFLSSSGDEPCSPGQWDTSPRATPHPRG